MLRGGLQLFEGDALLWVLSGTSRGFEAYGGFDPSEVRGVFNAGFFLVTLLEIGALLVVHSRTFRFFWLVGISASHLAIIGLMNIMFWENILLLWTTFGWQWRNAQCAERVGLSPPP
jgi:hypothetical protein